MGKKKYVAYVGTYTHGTSKGIQVYDVDVEKGTLTERSEVEVSNASHLAVSKNGKYLYSIEDEGVAVFERDKNGDLTRLNSVRGVLREDRNEEKGYLRSKQRKTIPSSGKTG